MLVVIKCGTAGLVDGPVRLHQYGAMYHYDPVLALEEFEEDAVLPHPAHLRDLIVRARLGPVRSVELNRAFQKYIQAFGELQALVRPVLEELARAREQEPGKDA